MRKKTSNYVDNRYRNVATIVYPESAPPDWVDILKNLHIPAFVSPLHDRDVNADGTEKKPHYHVMIMFEGKKSETQMRELIECFGGVGLERIESMRSYARYLCHLDNPEKVRYNVDDVLELSGACYSEKIGTVLDKYRSVREMVNYCVDNHIVYFADLLEYTMNSNEEWFRTLCDNGTYIMDRYIKSLSFKLYQNEHMSEREIMIQREKMELEKMVTHLLEERDVKG